jgi:hypothetical protein
LPSIDLRRTPKPATTSRAPIPVPQLPSRGDGSQLLLQRRLGYIRNRLHPICSPTWPGVSSRRPGIAGCRRKGRKWHREAQISRKSEQWIRASVTQRSRRALRVSKALVQQPPPAPFAIWPAIRPRVQKFAQLARGCAVGTMGFGTMLAAAELVSQCGRSVHHVVVINVRCWAKHSLL